MYVLMLLTIQKVDSGILILELVIHVLGGVYDSYVPQNLLLEE